VNPDPLANAELSVMELLWDRGSPTARQIQHRL
jgi:predicted transcriptional regulator